MNRIALMAIRFYRRVIGPHLPRACRFTPSCSQYAIDAYSSRGFWSATRLTLSRLSRCHPWNPGGYDPVNKQ